MQRKGQNKKERGKEAYWNSENMMLLAGRPERLQDLSVQTFYDKENY
jgi:hypothetical protein